MRKKISIFLLTVFSLFFLLPKGAYASEATLEFKYKESSTDSLVVEIYLDTKGVNVNAVTADFTYPDDLLKITDIDIQSSLFDQFIEKDYKQSGTVYLSCVSLDGVSDEGNVATVTFEILAAGNATLKFTDEAAVLDTQNSSNILSTPQTATFNISEDLSVLPQTGVSEDAVTITGLITIVALVMIAAFAIVGITVWGGIYLSLGKWEVKTEGGFEVGGKKKKSAKKAVSKAKKKESKK